MFGNWLGVSHMGIVYHTSGSNKDHFVTVYGVVHMAQMLLKWSMVSHGSVFPFNSVCGEGTHESEQDVHFLSYGQASESALAKLSNVLLISKFNEHHSLPILFDLSETCDVLTASACPPLQLPGPHSPVSLWPSMVSDSLTGNSSSTELLKFAAA